MPRSGEAPLHPGLGRPSSNIASDTGLHVRDVLDVIHVNTEYIMDAANLKKESHNLQRISKASWSAWKEIEGLTPQARLFIWERVESFRILTLDIRRAIRTNAIDENKADLFCNGLNALSLDIMGNTTRSPLSRSNSTCSAGLFQDVNNVGIFGGTFNINNAIHQPAEPGLSDNLKQIRKILFIQTTVLFYPAGHRV